MISQEAPTDIEPLIWETNEREDKLYRRFNQNNPELEKDIKEPDSTLQKARENAQALFDEMIQQGRAMNRYQNDEMDQERYIISN